MGERIIEGFQYAANGYVKDRHVHLHGIIEEVYIPNTISFERHICPAGLSSDWIETITNIVNAFMKHAKVDNTAFDIEFKIDFKSNDLKVIEISPRAVVQYENLYALAMGEDMLTTLCSLACGDDAPKPGLKKYKFCHSCELRETKGHIINTIPTESEINAILSMYPDVKIVNRIPKGAKKLSDFMQSQDTYRYCIISIPGNSKNEIDHILLDIKKRLNYNFSPI